MNIEYVVGFLFSGDGQSVALIEKQKPEWQRGKWNGIGGKIEAGETPEEAMPREFSEETGVCIQDWELFARIEGPWGKLHCLVAHLHQLQGRPDLIQMEAERPAWVTVSLLRSGAFPAIPNLSWLVPLALDRTSGMVVCQDVVVNNTPEASVRLEGSAK